MRRWQMTVGLGSDLRADCAVNIAEGPIVASRHGRTMA
jgi:hypothetical protein